MAWLSRWGGTSRLAPGFLFVVFLLLYLLTLSNNYAPDGLAFSLLATRGDLHEPTFFQAEHLLYPATGWAWFRLWTFLGFDTGALLPLQMLNAIFGALGVVLFFLALRLILGAGRHGALLSLGLALWLGVGYGYWYHSSDAEDLIIANTFVLASFWLLMRLWVSPGGRGFLIVALAATFSLALLHHATQVLFLPALLLGLWLARRRWSELALFAAMAMVFVALPYLVVGALARGLISPGDYLSWVTAAPRVGVWGRVGALNLWRGLKTLINSIIHLGGGPDLRSLAEGALGGGNLVALVVFGVVLLVLLAVGLQLIRNWRRQRSILIVSGLWALAYALFALYWAPQDPQFWVGAMAPLGILLVLAARRSLSESNWGGGLLLLAVGGVFLGNLVPTMLPRHDLSRNEAYAKALCLSEHTEARDLVVAPGWGWAGSYLPYFSGREVFSIIDNYVMAAERDRERLFELLEERIKKTRSRGGRVFVARLFSLSEQDRDWLERTTGLAPGDIPLKGREAFHCPGEPLWEVVP